MSKILVGLSLIASFGFMPSAKACESSPSCPCHHKASQATNNETAPDATAKKKCKCTGTSDCTCKEGSCKCKKCGGADKVGFNFYPETHTIIARDASAGIRI